MLLLIMLYNYFCLLLFTFLVPYLGLTARANDKVEFPLLYTGTGEYGNMDACIMRTKQKLAIPYASKTKTIEGMELAIAAFNKISTRINTPYFDVASMDGATIRAQSTAIYVTYFNQAGSSDPEFKLGVACAKDKYMQASTQAGAYEVYLVEIAALAETAARKAYGLQ